MTVSLDQVGDVSELEALGLDQTALDVYRALLEDPESDERTLSRSLHLDSDMLRSTMQRLRDLQLLVPTWTMPGREHAVQPSVGIQILLQQRRVELTRQQEQLQRTEAAAAAVAEQLNELLSTREVGDVELLRGRPRANSRIAELALTVRRTVWVLNPGRLDAPDRPLDESPDRPLLERGVQIRMVYLASAASKPYGIEACAWYQKMGAEIRTVPTIPIRVVIFDQELAIMPLAPEDEGAGALVYRRPVVVALATSLFQSYWSQARRVFDTASANPDTLPSQEAELIRLLAEGATDEQVARKFGVSLRTVRRMASELSKRTGARSRFELGVRATQRGWIT